jgi:hypothetical protein
MPSRQRALRAVQAEQPSTALGAAARGQRDLVPVAEPRRLVVGEAAEPSRSMEDVARGVRNTQTIVGHGRAESQEPTYLCHGRRTPGLPRWVRRR